MTEPSSTAQYLPLRPPGPVLGILIFFHSRSLSAETVSAISSVFTLCISDVSREAANFTPNVPFSIMRLRPKSCLSILLGGSVSCQCSLLTVSHPGSQECLLKTPRLCISVQRFLWGLCVCGCCVCVWGGVCVCVLYRQFFLYKLKKAGTYDF